jgi:hypothetical protein
MEHPTISLIKANGHAQKGKKTKKNVKKRRKSLIFVKKFSFIENLLILSKNLK